MKRQQRDTARSTPSSAPPTRRVLPEDQSVEQSITAASAALTLAIHSIRHSIRQPSIRHPNAPSYCHPGPAAQLASLCQAYLGAMGGNVSAMGGGAPSTAGVGGAESNGAADDLHDDATNDAAGSSSEKRVRPSAPLRASPASPTFPPSPASSSRLLFLAPELVHSVLIFCDARGPASTAPGAPSTAIPH